ncbi:MAG: M23 family metallopeptidase [Saprospiraceae bacterium]|nr:M23 family metallopeptidase [Saprospiraceae bacterium]
MRKEKYIYNQQTLRYEKSSLTLKQHFLRIFGVMGCIAIYTFALVYFLYDGSQASNELADIKQKYQAMNYQLDMMNKALSNIHERDAAIYRQVLEMEPTDLGIWNGGRGGSDKYADLRNLSDAELLIATSKKLSKLRHQLAVSAKSQDAIIKQAQDKEKMLSAIPSIRPIRKLKKKIQHLSGFGYRTHPVFKRRKMHTGIDFGARRGTPIYATGDGKIARIEYKRTGYGRNVVIDHGYGYKTLYAHMSKVKTKVGQKVKRGEIIGLVGSSGTSTSPHVHYEVLYKGKKINPLPFCLDGLSPEEYKAFVIAATAENQAMSIE